MPTPTYVQFGSDAAGKRRLTLESGGDTIELQQVEPFAPDAAALAAFAGEYESAELDTRWRLEVVGAALALRPRRGPALPLQPAYTDAFTGPAGLMRVQRDAQGRIEGLAIDVGRARDIRFVRVGAPPTGAAQP